MIYSLDAPVAAVIATSLSANIGSFLRACSLSPTATNGYACAAVTFNDTPKFQLPSSAFIVIANGTVAGAAPAVVRFQLDYTIVTTLGAITNGTITLDWNVPNPWPAGNAQRILIDAGGSQTWAPGTFRRDDALGLRIQRIGNAAQDTYPNAILLGGSVNVQIGANLPVAL